MVGKYSSKPFFEDLRVAPILSLEFQSPPSFTPQGPTGQIVEIKLVPFSLVTMSFF